MRVLVTGATGFIGSAVVRDLLAHGHEVVGLARSDASATALAGVGIEAHRGDLTDLDSLAAGARACDGVIHTAFIHDFSQYEANAKTDERALEAIAEAMAGTGKPLVVTSGVAVLDPGVIGFETDKPVTEGLGSIRARSEAVLAAAKRDVRVSVVRLPPTVHGRGDHGFVPGLIDLARRSSVSAYVGDGANRWPAVHRLDAARLFVLALERGTAGVCYHGVAEEGVDFKSIAQTIGAGLGLPVHSIDAQAAPAHFDWMALFAAADMPASSAQTQEGLGWHPTGPKLLTDLREAGYFN